MRHFKKIKLIIQILLLGALFGITYSFFYSVYENIKVNDMITSFVSRANKTPVLEDELDLATSGTYIRRYFDVPRETSHEKDGKNVFMDDEKNNLGQIGDIITSQQSPFPTVFGFHQFMTYYYGGHAALKSSETKVIEATGFPEPDESLLSIIFNKGYKGHGFSTTASINSVSYWNTPNSNEYYFDNFYRSKYIGLRPVNPFTGENKDELYEEYLLTSVNKGLEKIENEALYNFLFFLNMRRKYYCTDFVSRMYEEAYQSVMNNNKNYESKGYAKRMNEDGFITSVNDLILSSDTFITFYVEIKEEIVDGNVKIVENVYYLEDEVEI